MKIIQDDGTLNPAVLEMLLKFYLAPTLSTEQEFRTPNVKCKLNDVTDDYRREFILYNFHEMYSQRRQDVFNLQIPEIYNWERIYKVRLGGFLVSGNLR